MWSLLSIHLYFLQSVPPPVPASVPPPEKKIEKPVERKKPTKLLVDLADKETCSDKQRYEFMLTSCFLFRDIWLL